MTAPSGRWAAVNPVAVNPVIVAKVRPTCPVGSAGGMVVERTELQVGSDLSFIGRLGCPAACSSCGPQLLLTVARLSPLDQWDGSLTRCTGGLGGSLRGPVLPVWRGLEKAGTEVHPQEGEHGNRECPEVEG